MWMGGFPPLGYDVKDRKLVVNETEAETVRYIFRRYVQGQPAHRGCSVGAPGSRRVSVTNPGTSRVCSAPTSRIADQTASVPALVKISLRMDPICGPWSLMSISARQLAPVECLAH